MSALVWEAYAEKPVILCAQAQTAHSVLKGLAREVKNTEKEFASLLITVQKDDDGWYGQITLI